MMVEIKPIEEMPKGWLGFLDILGFREGVMGHNSENYVETYLQVINQLIERINREKPKLDILVVSDSIIITAGAADDDGPIHFIEACSALLFNLIISNIPVRGSITWGKYRIRNLNSGKCIAGPALVEAYELEQRLNWVGIVVAPSAQEILFDFFEKFSWLKPIGKLAMYFRNYDKIPLKTKNKLDDFFKGFVIYPRSVNGFLENFNQFKRSLNRLCISNIETDIRAKYEKTIEFYNMVYKEFGEYHGPVNMETLFQAYKIFATIEYDSRMRPQILEAAMKGSDLVPIIEAAKKKVERLKSSGVATNIRLIKKGL